MRLPGIPVIGSVVTPLCHESGDSVNRLSCHNNLNEAFEARVAAAPDAEAVVCGEVRLTAAELNARANA
ncbi:hypothetical protein ACWDOR_42850, partial [Streptosporangium canum]